MALSSALVILLVALFQSTQYAPDILQERLAYTLRAQPYPAPSLGVQDMGDRNRAGNPLYVERVFANDACTTSFFVQETGGPVSSVTVSWREAAEVRVSDATVSWRDSSKRYRVSLGSASSARGFAEDLRALVAACSEGRAQVTPTRPNPATPQGSAGQQAGASDCFVPDLEPAAIISACNAIITAQAQRLLDGGTPPPLPEQVRPLLHRSTAYQRSNDHRRAIEDLSTIIRLAPNVAMGYFLRGSARRLANQPEAALQDIDAGLRIAPANREGRLSRAGVLIDLGREREALEATDALASSAPDFAHAHNLACWIRAAYHGRELDQARRSCDEAIRLAPTEPSFYDSRGMVGLKQERWREAWQDYGRAVQLDATSAHALFGRGIAALRLGRTAEGNADLAEAIRLDASITGQYDRYGIVR